MREKLTLKKPKDLKEVVAEMLSKNPSYCEDDGANLLDKEYEMEDDDLFLEEETDSSFFGESNSEPKEKTKQECGFGEIPI